MKEVNIYPNIRKSSYHSGSLFWGSLLVALGGTLIAHQLQLWTMPWAFIRDYWAVILIIWGISVMAKGTAMRWLPAILFGVVVGFAAGSFWTRTDDLEGVAQDIENTLQELEGELNTLDRSDDSEDSENTEVTFSVEDGEKNIKIKVDTTKGDTSVKVEKDTTAAKP